MRTTLRAALAVWLGLAMLAMAGAAPLRAQSVLQQVVPGLQQQQEQPPADNDTQNAPGEQSGQPKEAGPSTPAAQVTAVVLPPGIAEAVGKGRRQADQFAGQLEQLETKVADPSVPRDELTGLRSELEVLREDIRKADLELQGPLGQIRDQVARLPAAPKEGETEPDSVAAQRAQLNKANDELAGAKAQLALVAGSAEQLATRAAQIERTRFLNNLLGNSRSILNPLLWSEGVAQLPDFWARLTRLVRSFNAELSQNHGNWAIWLAYAGLLLLGAATVAACRMIARRARRGSPGEAEFQKWLRTVMVPIGYTLVTLLAVVVFLVMLESLAPENLRAQRVFEALGGAAIAFAFARGVARSILSPTRPEWRAAPLSSTAASEWLALATIAFAVVSLQKFMQTLTDVINMDARFDVVFNALTAIVLALIAARLILIGRRESQSEADHEPGHKPGFHWAGLMVQPAWLLVIAAIIALVLGYITLGVYLTTNLFIIAPALVLLYCIRRLSDAFVAQSLKPKSRIARTLKSAFSMSDKGINRAAIAMNAGVDISLLLLGLPLVLGLTSLTWVDIRSWLTTAFFGFKVGDITISLSSILLALGVFTIGLVLTRFVTGWLDRRILTPTDMDAGVRNSLKTASGYLAVIVVLLMAFAAA